MNWLTTSLSQQFLGLKQRQTYPFVFLKNYLKNFAVFYLIALLTLIHTSDIIFAEAGEILPWFKTQLKINLFELEIFLNLLLIFSYLFFWKIYKKTDFFSRFSPILLLGIYNIIAQIVFVYINSFSMQIAENFNFLWNSNSEKLKEVFKFKKALSHEFIMYFFNFFFVLMFFSINSSYWKNLLQRLRASPQTFIFYLLILILFFIFYSSNISNKSEETSGNQLNLVNYFKNGSLVFRIFFMFNVILIIPFFEEIIYRYLPTQIFGSKDAVFWIFLFAVTWFALAHIRYTEIFPFSEKISFSSISKNLFQEKLLAYWIMSFILISIYWVGNFSLFYPIVFHFLINVIATMHF